MTTTVTNSGFLTALYVVIVPFLSLLFLRKIPHWVIWPAALLAFVGIFLLSGGQFSGFSMGDTLTILSAFFFAIQLLLIGLLVGDSGRPMALCLFQFAICGLAGTLLAVVFEPIDMARVMTRWPEITFVGVFHRALASSARSWDNDTRPHLKLPFSSARNPFLQRFLARYCSAKVFQQLVMSDAQ